jgi:hypothetical protein
LCRIVFVIPSSCYPFFCVLLNDVVDHWWCYSLLILIFFVTCPSTKEVSIASSPFLCIAVKSYSAIRTRKFCLLDVDVSFVSNAATTLLSVINSKCTERRYGLHRAVAQTTAPNSSSHITHLVSQSDSFRE